MGQMDFQVLKAQDKAGGGIPTVLLRLTRGGGPGGGGGGSAERVARCATWLFRGLLVLLLLCSAHLWPEAARQAGHLLTGRTTHSLVLHYELSLAEKAHRVALAQRRELVNGSLTVDTEMDAANLRNIMLLPTYSCPLEVRLGAWGEGGKWVCLRHHNSTRTPVVVSIGSNGDTSFERDMFRTFAAVSHTFDFSLDGPTRARVEALPYIKFYNKGLAGKKLATSLDKKYQARSSTFLSIFQTVEAVGARYVDIFKIDCEGCEFEVVSDMGKVYTRDTVPFGQILMETHFLGSVKLQMALLLTLEGLGYRMFHAEPNPFWSQGYEVAFIHEKLVMPRKR